MSTTSRIRILRIRQPANLLTAQAYEELFDRQLGTAFDVTVAPLERWFESVLGQAGSPLDLDAAASRFAAVTSHIDFFCPNYQAMPLAPLLLAIRNRARARARLLFIGHASGAYSYEWALMRPLLAAGDVIIAPSESARRTIEHLAPELAPFVRAIPHPMAPLVRSHAPAGIPLVVSIGRIHAQKLTHRQIEAMAILRDRGRNLRMEIAGPLDDGGWNGPHPYTRTLLEQVRRLGLGDSVRFVGAVRGDAAKSEFLSRASVVVNLSTTIEESFPKTPIEALGVGVPVVGTNWNGLRDTVGRFGQLVPVAPVGALGAVDVDATAVADAIASLLDAPPSPDTCIAWTQQFSPEVILPRYRAALESGAAIAAMSASGDAEPSWPDETLCAAPAGGLLSGAAPLTAMSWRELFETYVAWTDSLRRSWMGAVAAMPTNGERVRNALVNGIEPALQRYFGNISEPRGNDDARSVHSVQSVPRMSRNLFDSFETAVLNPGVLETRTACLGELVAANRLSAAARALDALAVEGLPPAVEVFWRVELALARGDASRALAESLACVRSTVLVASDWPLVRQAARAARRAQAPGAAVPALLAWLTRFPDSQESGPVWLDTCVNALKSGDCSPALLETYLGHARTLLGDLPAIQKCARSIAAAQETQAMQEIPVLVG
jgi:glycosyltransferase involved in cell wall biosynthesis